MREYFQQALRIIWIKFLKIKLRIDLWRHTDALSPHRRYWLAATNQGPPFPEIQKLKVVGQ